METKKQKQEKLKDACRKINVEVIFFENIAYFCPLRNLIPIAIGHYAGNTIIRLNGDFRGPWQQEKYNQIFNIIQQINEN
jgi:hypothetical protein